MKIRHLLITTSLFLFSVFQAVAQVTIGSNESPLEGALLDLKEQTPDSNNITSTRGLNLPRVNLTDKYSLYPMFDGDADYTGNAGGKKDIEDAIHTGLLVYHPERCSMNGKGVYVWTGTQWQPLHKGEPVGVSLSPQSLYVPSGEDLRTLQTAYNFDISWTPSGTGIASPIWTQVGGFPSLTLTPNPLPETSPQTMTVRIPAMTAADTNSNIFASREAALSFTLPECPSHPQTLVINQTNKALTIDGRVQTIHITNPVNGSNLSNVLGSNAIWKLSAVYPETNSAFTNVQLDGVPLNLDEHHGTELYDGTGLNKSLTYTIQAGSSFPFYNRMLFSDSETPKRFADVAVTVMQCTDTFYKTQLPIMSEWAMAAGFPDVAEIKISDEDDAEKGINTAHPISSIAWHRDQEGNIFLSASFDKDDITGDTNRWMITNMAASSYAPNGTRTGDDNVVINTPVYTSDIAYNSSRTPYWGYPKTEGSSSTMTTILNYTRNPRIGYIYNWQAATNCKAGTSNTVPFISEGEDSATPQTEKRQGICPNGWHLPSDVEWTALEQEISDNASLFSTEEDGTVTIGPGGDNIYRGNKTGLSQHSRAMKEQCQGVTGNPGVLSASSNFIGTTERVGFVAWLSLSRNSAYFWTSSGASHDTSYTDFAWSRLIHHYYGGVNRLSNFRYSMYSVRCKKDN